MNAYELPPMYFLRTNKLLVWCERTPVEARPAIARRVNLPETVLICARCPWAEFCPYAEREVSVSCGS